MKYPLLFLIAIAMSCGSDTSSSTANEKPDKLYEKEKFQDFFYHFATDSLFQMDRVKFPLIVKSVDEEGILVKNKRTPTDWTHLTFEYRGGFAKRAIDAYTQEIRVFSDSVKIELRGIDNGIYVDYLFYNIDGLWYLALARDYSD